jgi:glyoxylase-like metal-dependent hydrolase (beta-lactamase superfamily II)
MANKFRESSDNKFIPMTSINSGKEETVSTDVFYYTNQIVNVVFIGAPNSKEWVMVDTGMPKCGDEIREAAEKIYGKGSKPAAILLTHGHFDHVGGVVRLLETWNVPVFAHKEEFPFLTGAKAYHEPDASVEGGLLAKIASIYPIEPIDITPALQPLPDDGSVPFLPDWHWVAVPGHSPGQVAFFREQDRLLISADAVITVRQDSLYKVLLQKEEVNGPPRYFTTDWAAAQTSVIKLYMLNPKIMIPGHGHVMRGAALTAGLKTLVEEFRTMALPAYGKYVRETGS